MSNGEEGPGADPEHDRRIIITHSWPGSALVSPWISWKRWFGQREHLASLLRAAAEENDVMSATERF